MRKGLGFLGTVLSPLTLFSNVTLMHSEIALDPASQASATNLKRRMVGQAPYVINAGLSYVSGSGSTSATVLFNRIGDRIDAAGDSPLPDVVEQARNVLDFSLRFPLVGGRVRPARCQEPPRRAVSDRPGDGDARVLPRRAHRADGHRLAPVNVSGVTSS